MLSFQQGLGGWRETGVTGKTGVWDKAGEGLHEGRAALPSSSTWLQEGPLMTARDELQTLTENWLSAFHKGDLTPFLNALGKDLEVIDTVPYRFDDKASFVDFLQASM